jgi:cysteine-rich repeat protein
VEGSEECDDGDKSDGDGCSSACRVEPGWSCNGSPSKCVKDGGASRPPAPAPRPAPGPAPRPGPAPAPAPAPAGAGAKGHGSKAGSIAAGLLVPLFVVLVAGAAWGNREAVFEQFPAARDAVDAVHGALSKYIPGLKPPGARYGHLSLDPEELDVSPEFLSPTPLRPPGAPGSYEPLPGDGGGRPA